MTSSNRGGTAVLLLVLTAGLLVAALGSPAGAAPSFWTPPPDTITRVEGNKRDGFTVHFFDGSSIAPPTDSEARAECDEYDRRLQRVRCRTEVRVWYDGLGDTKRALRLAWLSRH
jgi:hypothetical protein